MESLLTMEDAIKAVEKAFKHFSLGDAQMPVRSSVTIEKHGGQLLTMPAYVGGRLDALGTKLVTVYPENPSRFKLPTIIGTMTLNDANNGALLAIMDGTHLTAMRTGAASGVATKYLSREDSTVVGVFGAGAQARTQLMGVCHVRKITEAKVYSPYPEELESYAKEMSAKLRVKVTPVKGPREAVAESDIIITATTSKTPVFDAHWLKAGSHINGIGSHTPDARELDETTIMKSKVIVDSREAALKEAGDIIIPLKAGQIEASHIHAEIGEVIAGRKPGRESNEITVFKSVGLAVQDVSTAVTVYQKALERKVGTNIEL